MNLMHIYVWMPHFFLQTQDTRTLKWNLDQERHQQMNLI